MDETQFVALGEQVFAEFQSTKHSLQDYKKLSQDEFRQIGRETLEDYQTGSLEITEQSKSQPVFDLLDDLVNMPVNASSPVKQEAYVAEETLYSFEELPPSSSVIQDDKSVTENGSMTKLDPRPNSEPDFSLESDSAMTKPLERFDRKSNFGVLQDHINVLTEENCELRRALELQQRLTENLTAENQQLSDEYNTQGQQLEDFQNRCTHYESLLQEQHETMSTLLHGQETSKAAELSAQARIKGLVQENVVLEDRLRDVRVSEIRLQKTVETLKSDLTTLTKKQSKMEIENRNLTDILNNIREENNVLRAQIRRTPEETKNLVKLVDHGCQTEIEKDSIQINEDDQEVTKEEILESLKMKDLPELNPEEASVLSSVHELMNALEDQRRAMIAKLRASKNEITKLKEDNAELTIKASNQRPQSEIPANTSRDSKDASSSNSANRGWFGFRRGRNTQGLLD